MPSYQFRSFERHAEVYGTELVYETAERELPIEELTRLVRRLRTLNPRWRLTEEQRWALFDRLDPRRSDRELAQDLGVVVGTVKRMRETALERASA